VTSPAQRSHLFQDGVGAGGQGCKGNSTVGSPKTRRRCSAESWIGVRGSSPRGRPDAPSRPGASRLLPLEVPALALQVARHVVNDSTSSRSSSARVRGHPGSRSPAATRRVARMRSGSVPRSGVTSSARGRPRRAGTPPKPADVPIQVVERRLQLALPQGEGDGQDAGFSGGELHRHRDHEGSRSFRCARCEGPRAPGPG